MLKLIPRVQTEGDTCGLTATAVTLDFLLNKSYSDEDIKAKYGYSLLTALNTELAGSGIKYSDIGNLDSIAKFDSIQASLDAGCPAIIGLNGERFSHSGRGHIVAICSIDGDKVSYANSADGQIDTCAKQEMLAGQGYPGGDFIFCGTNGKVPVAPAIQYDVIKVFINNGKFSIIKNGKDVSANSYLEIELKTLS